MHQTQTQTQTHAQTRAYIKPQREAHCTITRTFTPSIVGTAMKCPDSSNTALDGGAPFAPTYSPAHRRVRHDAVVFKVTHMPSEAGTKKQARSDSLVFRMARSPNSVPQLTRERAQRACAEQGQINQKRARVSLHF